MTDDRVETAHARLMPLVGQAGPEVRGSISARDARRFAVAAGDGQEPGVPALMLSSTLEWESGPPLDDLREDGTGVGREAWLPLEGLRLMGGGQDLEFHDAPAYDEEFTAVPALDRVDLKAGGGGALLLMEIVTVFRGADGRDLLTCRETLIGR